jgi:hypothetical protein
MRRASLVPRGLPAVSSTPAQQDEDAAEWDEAEVATAPRRASWSPRRATPRPPAHGGQALPKMLKVPSDAHVLGMSIIGRGVSAFGGEVATVHFNATSLPLLSALKFVGRWALEERNPWLHHRFGNRETGVRRLRISSRKPLQQLIRRYIEKVDFAAGPKLLRSRPIVFAFFSCPEAEIEDDIRSQFQRSTGDGPQQRFNETMPSLMFWLLSILTEKTYVPFIRCQSQGRLLTLKLLRKRGFSRARKSNHQMESRHTYSSWSW